MMLKYCLFACLVCGFAPGLAVAQSAESDGLPTLNDLIDGPEWLDIRGESRWRYESLDGQFRQGLSGSDQVLAGRTLIKAQATFKPLTLTAELEDARAYLNDDGTPVSTSLVNTFEFIEANVTFHLDDIFGRASQTDVKIGRQTVDVGSERFIERNGFRNAINSFDGVHLTTEWDNGAQLDALYVAPVRAFPRNFADLSNNVAEADRTDDAVRFWGLIYTDRDNWFREMQTELFIYGLNEKDTADRRTADRQIYTLGFRSLRKSTPGQWDHELEFAYQFGERREGATDNSGPFLDVKAQMLHAELGYNFDMAWNPRVAFELDYASGDGSPTDGVYGHFDRQFGARGGDVGFTSIYGPFVRSNLILPGIDMEFKPNARTDLFLNVQLAYLDKATDKFDVPNLIDPTGQSGRFIGQTIDARVRRWLIPDRLRWDIGGSVFLHGEFLDNVPNGPDSDRTLYGFTQFVAKF